MFHRLNDWFNVDLNSRRKYSIIKRLRQNVCWLECTSCKYTIDYIQNDICHSHALYHIFLTWNDMHNSNYLTIKLQLYDNSDWVPKEPLEEYLWSDVAGIQSPTNSLGSPSPPVTQITMVDGHSILVCAENQRNHQWGCILREHFVVFHPQSCVSLNIYKY